MDVHYSMPRPGSRRTASSSWRPCRNMDAHCNMPRQSSRQTVSASWRPRGRMEPHRTMPLESCGARDGPRALPGGRAADWDHIAICRHRAHGGPGRALQYAAAELKADREPVGGRPRARPGDRAAGCKSHCMMPLESCKPTTASSGRRPASVIAALGTQAPVLTIRDVAEEGGALAIVSCNMLVTLGTRACQQT